MQCRGCMQSDCEVVQMSSIVSEDGQTYYDYFNECTQLNATTSDQLPRVLCINCVENLQVAYHFRREAVRCDNELNKLVTWQRIEPELMNSPTDQLEILEELEEYKLDPLCIYDREKNEENLFGISEEDLKTEISVEILNISEEKALYPSILNCNTKNSSQIIDNNSKKFQNTSASDNDFVEDNDDQKPILPTGSDKSNPNSPSTRTSTVLNKHNKNMDMAYECPLCLKRFCLKRSLQKHIAKKHDEDKKPSNENLVACKYCNKELAASKIYDHESHHAYRLKKTGKFLCSLCPREFKCEINLRSHERVTHLNQKNLQPKECPICHKKFSPWYYRSHIVNVHASDSEFICDICGASYKSNVYLNNHKRLHLDRKFPCTLCNKKYIRQADLKVHMRFHTGEQPYTCDLCGKGFTIKGKLNYHMQNHAGIKRKCMDCGKEFNKITQLKIHSYKHTGMPYKCNICNYGCPKRDVFRKHLLRLHDMTMTPAEYNAMFQANTGRNAAVLPLEELQMEEMAP